MRSIRRLIGYALIVAGGLVLGGLVRMQAVHDHERALAHYAEESDAEVFNVSRRVRESMNSIYENLRTLSLLPSVRNIDRHGENIGKDGLETVQQVYNNLANSVSISEVYIVPSDLDPDKVDPVTGKAEQPILMFDQLIIHGGKYSEAPDPFQATMAAGVSGPAEDEIEIYEYRLLREQGLWLQSHFPDSSRVDGLSAPMISGPEVITCDNTQFVHTHSDPDRSGVLLSVPFFGPDNQLKGMVTAIILSSALRGLLPQEDFALINVGYDYTSRPSVAGEERTSADWIKNGEPNPHLIYSKVVPLDVSDVKSPWKLWVGFPDARFSNGLEARSVRSFELNGYIVVLVLVLAGCMWLSLTRRNYELARAAGAVLEKRVEERTAEIRHLASHDALTGLPNRALLYEEIEGALRRAGRSHSVAVLCVDLDRFKGVNDTLGHPIGDALLRAVTERLKKCVREFDVVARLGGDEFVVVLTDMDDPEQAGVLGQRIIENISEPFDVEGHQILVGASVGVAVAPADGNNSALLLKNADVALYKAKTDGRGTCRFFELAMDIHLQERRRLELDLRRALRESEFELYYQPIVDAETRQIGGFEALLRWNHPERGLVMPSDFVPLAEETGIIIPIGQWVLSRACADAAQWPKDVQIAVNLSPVQFNNNALISTVVSALRDSGLQPARLQLEITESVLLTNNEASVAMLHQLRALGVRIVMDDFGTGYSSLSYLRTFPFDKIKVDRSFIHDLVGNDDCVAIVRAIASLGKSLGMVTTAEGVETDAEIGLVRELGCGEAQGYLFGRPLPVGSVTALLHGKLSAVA